MYIGILNILKILKFSAINSSGFCFSNFVNSPLINRVEKRKIIVEILEKIKVSPLTVNLFDTLAENNRLAMTENVLKAFGELITAHKGQVVGKVTTAEAMDAATSDEVKKVSFDFFLYLKKASTNKVPNRFKNSYSFNSEVLIAQMTSYECYCFLCKPQPSALKNAFLKTYLVL